MSDAGLRDAGMLDNGMRDAGLLDPLRHGLAQSGGDPAELTGDPAFLQAMVDVECALTLALVDAGLAPSWMTGVCSAIADASALDLDAIAREGRGGGNPVIPLVKHLGRAADAVHAGASDHLHIGATSQDVLDSAAMVVAVRVTEQVRDDLQRLAQTLAALAAEHRRTVLTGRTLGSHASPTTFGFVVAGWLDAVLTAMGRVAATRAALPVQYGGAVGTLAVLTEVAAARRAAAPAAPAVALAVPAARAAVPAARAAVPDAAATTGLSALDATPDDTVVVVVVDRLAAALRLAVPPLSWHTNRVAVTDLGATLATVVGVAGKIAADLAVFSRTEIGEVSERLGAGEGGSSAMPHKRNPVTSVLLSSAARQAPGLLATLFSSLPAEDQRPSGAWHAEWQTLRSLERLALEASGAAASLASRLDVDIERMRANLEITDGLVFSERVTTLLAETLGKNAAFDLLQRATAESIETNRPLRVVLGGTLASEGAGDALRTRVWNAFDPDTGVSAADRGIDAVLGRFRALGLREPSPTTAPSPTASPREAAT